MNHWKVSRGHRGDNEAPQSRRRKDRLGHDCPAQHVSELQAHQRQDRYQRITQDVLPDDRGPGQALGVGGSNVVMRQHLPRRLRVSGE